MSRRSGTIVRWLGYLAIAVSFAIVCAFLSQWQFARNTERAGQLALVERNFDAPPAPLDDILGADFTFDPVDEWRAAIVRGSYLPEHQLLVRNRPHGGTSAFEVLVPLRTLSGDILIVNRGWVRPGNTSPEPDIVPAAPGGEVTVTVRLRTGEALPRSGRGAPDGQVPTINLPGIAAHTGLGSAVITSSYGALISEDPAPATVPQPWEPPSTDPGPHLSYAVQWILFAVMGFVFIGYVIRSERSRRSSDGTGTARRRDRDAETEDAILDAATPPGENGYLTLTSPGPHNRGPTDPPRHQEE